MYRTMFDYLSYEVQTMFISHLTQFDDLPYEVQTMVISHLTQFDLASCIRVCKAWSKMTYPFLWRHIRDPPPTYLIDDDSNGNDSNDDDDSDYDKYFKPSIQTSMFFLDSFLTGCPSTFPRLTSLSIDGAEYGDGRESNNDGGEKDLAQLLDRCSAGLKRFSFSPRLEGIEGAFRGREYYKIGDKTVEALIKHAATLEVVQFGGDYVCGWQQIDRLLCSLPKLKEIYFEYSFLRGGRLEARKILDSEWVCLDLEVLGCMIGGIPRPGHPRSLIILREVTVSNQERLDLHHQVYAKLARFTKLREFRDKAKKVGLSIGISKSSWNSESSGTSFKKY
ncbi:hypothetical protein BKA57DRAFT_488453 [Linnemannia elongata]|nr:hypothetical protein BKA57DRAFT_488453 [Linnemannia elongata]